MKLAYLTFCYNPSSCIQVIILSRVGVQDLKRVLIFLVALLSACLAELGCGGSQAPSTGTTGVTNRAFISNSVSAGTLAAGVDILNAETDVRASGAAISAGNNPGMMVVTPSHAQTVVFSGNGEQDSDNLLTFINNTSEQAPAHVTLPGMTESILVSPDSSTVYVAVPTAPVVGQPPGLVEVVSTSSGTFTGQVAVPAVHYLSISNSGNFLFGFSDNSDSVAVITPTLIGVGNAVTYICCFDSPVSAFFSSGDTTAFVVNCGAECGGTQASVQPVDMTTSPPTPGVAVPVPAASIALVNNSTMYLAGTPVPASPCTGEVTQATTCGLLTTFNLSSMTVTNSTPIIITDGYHNRIAMGANGQLYIGARTCTEVVPPVPPPAGAEVRGCLSIYNTLGTAVGTVAAGGVVIPPENGDVTGIQPIATRVVVYVVQGGSLSIYSDLIDALEYNPNDPNNPGQINNLVGQFVDIKTVDF